ncbi:MAG: mechanosensitive ion channel family protein [Myxococcales bacterium]|nr:mechanosensitive ion channel family protein [Myxococcales bacterium]
MVEQFWAIVDAVKDSVIAQAIGILVVSIIGGWLLTRILRYTIVRITRRTKAEWDDNLGAQLAGPVSLFVAIQVFRIGLEWLEIDLRTMSMLRDAMSLLSIMTVEWALFRAIDLFRDALAQRSWAIDRPASRSLLALGARFTKAAVMVLGTLVALSQLGVSVASLIAGLGIGGLVIALAAQKTVENLFGAVSIGIDQPLREGDFVKVYDVVGTVEQIGLRSTRIRTQDRTIVTIPNGELANQRIESYTVRDRMRLACMIGLVYATTAEQMRTVIRELDKILRDHPQIWPDGIVVKLKQLGSSSLDIEVVAWFQTADWAEFQGIREGVLIAFMEAIERAGTSMAFPTQTVHVVQPSSPA